MPPPDVWDVWCTQAYNYRHSDRCGEYVACPKCGKANPNPPNDRSSSSALTVLRSSRTDILTTESSRSRISNPPGAMLQVTTHRNNAIQRDRALVPTRPNAGSARHQDRGRIEGSEEMTIIQNPHVIDMVMFVLTIMIQTAKKKWQMGDSMRPALKRYLRVRNVKHFVEILRPNHRQLQLVLRRTDIHRYPEIAYAKPASANQTPVFAEENIFEDREVGEAIELFDFESIKSPVYRIVYLYFRHRPPSPEPDVVIEDSDDEGIKIKVEGEPSRMQKRKRTATLPSGRRSEPASTRSNEGLDDELDSADEEEREPTGGYEDETHAAHLFDYDANDNANNSDDEFPEIPLDVFRTS
uniref:Multidrug resistance protein MdtG n=1 Tax=Talaromyces marneffei PM1 TaxID=1077442 RepID=A0A093X788_TALMA